MHKSMAKCVMHTTDLRTKILRDKMSLSIVISSNVISASSPNYLVARIGRKNETEFNIFTTLTNSLRHLKSRFYIDLECLKHRPITIEMPVYMSSLN